MLSDREFSKLLVDVKKMSREIADISKNDPDPTRRAQAKRWVAIMLRESDCVRECLRSER
jgi:hypothetical protein